MTTRVFHDDDRLTVRELAILRFLATRAGGGWAAVWEISERTPGGRPVPTLLRLHRRGFVLLSFGLLRPDRVNSAEITESGALALVSHLAQTNA